MKARLVDGPFAGQEVRVLGEARTPSGVKVFYVERRLTPTKKASAQTHLQWVAGSYLQMED